MTADWARLPAEVLDTISSRIIREVPGVNRVAYDITQQASRHDRVGVERSSPVLARPCTASGSQKPSPLFHYLDPSSE